MLGRSPEIACISSGNRFTIRIQSRNPAFVHGGWRVWCGLRGVAATSCSSLLRRWARKGSAFRAHGRCDRSDGSGFRSSCRCFRLRRVGCLWRGASCDSAADGPSSFCSPFRTLPRTVRDIRRCHNGTRNMKEKDYVPPAALFVSLRFVGHIFAGTNDPPEVSFFMSLQP